MFRKIRLKKNVFIFSSMILILYILYTKKLDKILYVERDDNFEKWFISYTLEDTACLQLCKLHQNWNILCIQSSMVEDSFMRRSPKCEKNILWNVDTKNAELDALYIILKLGAKYIKIHNLEQHMNLSTLDTLFHNEFEHSLYENHSKTFENCVQGTHSLSFCKSSQSFLAFVPVPYISCSKDILTATGSLEKNFHIDFSTSVLTSDVAWILFFMNQYHTLENNEKTLLSCLALEIGQLQGKNVKFYLSSVKTRVLELDNCVKHNSLSKKTIKQLSSLASINLYIKDELTKILINSFPRLDPSLLSYWFQTLLSNGYMFLNFSESFLANSPFNQGNYLPESCITERFYPRISNNEHTRSNENKDLIKSTHKKICANFSFIKLNDNPKEIYSDITLIITFNYPHYEVIPLLEIMYRAIFPSIVYCGSEIIDTDFYEDLLKYKISFVLFEGKNFKAEGFRFDSGRLNHGCVTKVIEMNLNTRGYLVMSDDVVINNINLQSLNRDAPWYPEHTLVGIYDFAKRMKCINNQCIFKNSWTWFGLYHSECMNFFKELHHLSRNSLFYQNFYSTLIKLTGGTKRLFGGYSDFYYIPQKLSTQFYRITKLFLKHEIFFEIAIPNIFKYFQYAHNTMIEIEGSVQWNRSNRDLPWVHLTEEKMKNKHFYHPLKLNRISLMKTKHNVSFVYLKAMTDKEKNSVKKRRLTELFCTNVVPSLMNEGHIG